MEALVGRKTAAAAVAIAAAWASSAAAQSELRAERITPETAAECEVGGPDAIGGVGDWWLANGVVEAVIDDVAREYGVLTHGGTLIDVGLRDRVGEDQFARLTPLVNLSQRVVIGYDAIRAEVDPHGRFARIVATSSGMSSIPRGTRRERALDPLVPEPEAISAVRVETAYEVRPGESFVRIDTALTNTGSAAAPIFAFGDVWMRGGRGGRGFVGDALAPGRSRGFALRGMTPNIRTSLGALARLTHVALVGTADFPPIAYALDAPERAARGLPLFGVSGEHASLVFSLVGDPPVDELGVVALARAMFHTLAPGETWSWQRRLRVVGRRDIAAASDAIFADVGRSDGASGIEGRVDAGGQRALIVVETAGGAPVTQIGVDAPREPTGDPPAPIPFRASLPPGDYALELRIAHGAPQRRALHVAAGRYAEVAFATPAAPAHLVFAPAFADGGPGRIEIRGRAGTPDPVFGDDLLAATLDGAPLASGTATSAIVFLGNDRDPRDVALAPGHYLLTATRGLDWEAAAQRIDASRSEAAIVPPFALRPLAPLVGAVSADLHVHAEASDDSQVPNEERLRRFVAEGVDVLIATDHDHVANYGPALARLGVVGRVRVVQGVEVTGSAPSAAAPWTIGHHNAWPIPYVPYAHRHGAPASQNRTVGELYAELRRSFGARVVQLNHPRPTPSNLAEGDVDGAFFAHLGAGFGFDPQQPLTAPQNAALVRRMGSDGTRALDFDAIEVMNGDSYEQYLAARADWYALLRQGERRTATANSDSHAPDELAAYPRNYVWIGAAGDPQQVARSSQGREAAAQRGEAERSVGPREDEEASEDQQQVARSSQGREAAAQRGEAERSVGPREDEEASEDQQQVARSEPEASEDQQQVARSEPEASEDQQTRFDAALREGRSFGTTGPRVREFRVNGGSLGDLVPAVAGRAHVAYAVDAPSWVPIDEVRILVNGDMVRRTTARNGSFDLVLRRDAFVTLEAGAPLHADPELWIRAHPGPYTEVIAPGFVSTAFTNPIFVDVDGNGRFDPPGLR